MEYQLWALLLLIIDRGGLRKPRPNTQGCVLDAGAHDGATAVMLVNALRRLDLQVHALEPLARNAEVATRRGHDVPNLYVYRLGLGEVDGATGHYPAEYDDRKSSLHLQIARFRAQDNAGNASYPLTTIDSLFNDDAGRTLVLAHLDLEGREAERAARRQPHARARPARAHRRDLPALDGRVAPRGDGTARGAQLPGLHRGREGGLAARRAQPRGHPARGPPPALHPRQLLFLLAAPCARLGLWRREGGGKVCEAVRR